MHFSGSGSVAERVTRRCSALGEGCTNNSVLWWVVSGLNMYIHAGACMQTFIHTNRSKTEIDMSVLNGSMSWRDSLEAVLGEPEWALLSPGW